MFISSSLLVASRATIVVTVVALVERQKARPLSIEPNRHLNVGFADGKVDNGFALRLKQRTFGSRPGWLGLAVLLVLDHGLIIRISSSRICSKMEQVVIQGSCQHPMYAIG